MISTASQGYGLIKWPFGNEEEEEMKDYRGFLSEHLRSIRV